MSRVSPEQFFELVGKSKLLAEDQLAEIRQQFEVIFENQLPIHVSEIAEHFITNQLLTPWQCEKLLNGKYRGFFLNKYKLLKLLGTGGMSSVYLAEHSLMKRKVAIKVLPPRRVKDPAYLTRFQKEAEAIAQLDHQNIVRAFDIDQAENTHYIVMEYVSGRDLSAIVKEQGPLSFEKAATCIIQTSKGLQHLHESGLVHRDIKPANLLCDESGTIKILDMGLARFEEEHEASLTVISDQNILGTADYLAPEQALNSHQVDQRADIYSLGCTLYFLLVGHAPFSKGSLAQRIAKHQTEEPQPIRRFRSNCPASLERLCQQMMAKRLEQRFQSADEVVKQFQIWLDSRGRADQAKLQSQQYESQYPANKDKSLPQGVTLSDSNITAEEDLPRAELWSDLDLAQVGVNETHDSLITGESHVLTTNSVNVDQPRNKQNQNQLVRATPLTPEEEKILADEMTTKENVATDNGKLKSSSYILYLSIIIVSLFSIGLLWYFLSE